MVATAHKSMSSIFFLLLLCCPLLSSALQISYDGRALKIDGKRKIILSGSIHYPRSTPEMWPNLMRKAKEGGLNTIDTYVFWNAHEPVQGQYNFLGNNDLIRFLRVARDEGLFVMLRIGPYVCAEWNYGGFPVWLHNLPGIELRTDNPVYKREMQRFTGDIVNMVKHEKLFASQGGPIILAQIENEYGNIEWAYGDAGKKYIKWCANMAESMKVDVPWIMCQQGDAPDGIINTCNGYYCDQWQPHSKSVPKMWTENWAGWYKNWGGQDPHRTAEDVAFAVGRFFQYGGTMQNYYMYHGGTNFGRTSGGPYITTSYDYDAPLDEYGNLREPKYGHLRRLHQILVAHEDTIVYGDSNTTDLNNLQSVTKFTNKDKSLCIVGNAKADEDLTVTIQGKKFTVPAWSVTFLRDCQTEIYNTAKVNAQTSIMVKKPNEEDVQPFNLRWKWRGEPYVESVQKINGAFTMNQLIDQKSITNSTTDYLWYMTSVQMDDKSCPNFVGKDATLTVHTKGHTLHVFVNGIYTGAQYATNGHFTFDYTTQVRLKKGTNTISLLSGTVGLPNYGAHFDTAEVGIVGPVTLTLTDGPIQIIQDLSTNPWTYKIGLDGEHRRLFDDATIERNKWHTVGLPVNLKLHWYKANFVAPRGHDPVVVDLKGLGKGEAWINGQSIGRYWPSYLAGASGCDPICNYRGTYGSSKCQTNCGNPTQRWYHVPRSYLKDGDNTITLFEEAGGDPTFVNFRTVTVGKACLNAYEGEMVDLFCQNGGTITSIQFVSYGNPTGVCGSFINGNCEATNTRSFIEKECLRKKYCRFQVSETHFGSTGNCQVYQKRLAVEALCS